MSDHRCKCGSRVFTLMPIAVLTSDGDQWGMKDFQVAECVRCNRKVSIRGGNGEPKKIHNFPAGKDAEKIILQEIVEATKNKDYPGEPCYVARTEDDRRDLQRLGIEA